MHTTTHPFTQAGTHLNKNQTKFSWSILLLGGWWITCQKCTWIAPCIAHCSSVQKSFENVPYRHRTPPCWGSLVLRFLLDQLESVFIGFFSSGELFCEKWSQNHFVAELLHIVLEQRTQAKAVGVEQRSGDGAATRSRGESREIRLQEQRHVSDTPWFQTKL